MHKRALPTAEMLEPRRLLAAAPVDVNGTAGRDSIIISVSGSVYTVTVNAVQATHNVADVSVFIVRSSDGDDVIAIGAGVIGSYVDAGPGNDKISGGSNPDTLLGGAGK